MAALSMSRCLEEDAVHVSMPALEALGHTSRHVMGFELEMGSLLSTCVLTSECRKRRWSYPGLQSIDQYGKFGNEPTSGKT